MSIGHLTEEQIKSWTKYALNIECKRCGETIFAHEEDARDEVKFVADHYDLGPTTAAADWRLYLIDGTAGHCDYCDHVMTKDD